MHQSENHGEHSDPRSRDVINPEKHGQDSIDIQMGEGRWSPSQHFLFLRGLMRYGKDWKQLQKIVLSRTSAQVRSHAQKYFYKLTKINKERKKTRNKLPSDPTQLESEIVQAFTEDDISEKSPDQLILVLKRKFNTPIHQRIEGQRQQQNRDKEKYHQNTRNINQSHQFIGQPVLNPPSQSPQKQQVAQQLFGSVNEDQQDSYFLAMMKSHKIGLDSIKLGDLIDFGGPSIQENQFLETNFHKNYAQDQQSRSRRRKSFTLCDQSQSQMKLQSTLQKIRKGSN